MTSFDYRIAPEIFQSHPGYCRGVLVLDIASNQAGTLTAQLTQQLREAEQALRAAITGHVAEHPRIAAWREAYRAFGAKPSEHRSAVEALTRRVLKPDSLPDINPLVDIGNLVTLRYLLPAGVHPVPASAPTEPAVSLSLRKTTDGDRFLPPDGSPAEQPSPGEIVFAHGHEVLTRRWTWRQAAGTQTQPDTRHVLVNIDGLPPATEDEVLAAMQTVAGLAQQYCGAHVRARQVLTAQQPVLSWS